MSTVLSIRDVEMSLDPRVVENELRRKQTVTPQQLSVAIAKRAAMSETGDRLGLCEILVRDRFLGRQDAETFIRGLTEAEVNSADMVLGDDICQRYGVRPLQVVGGVLHLEAVGYLRKSQLEAIRSAANIRISAIKVVPTTRLEHHDHRRRLSATRLTLQEAISRLKRNDINSEDLRLSIEALINEAVNQRASDIHLDCLGDPNSFISFRVDGKMIQSTVVPERIMSAIFTRLKTIGGMDASDRMRPQDGRLSHSTTGRKIDLRLACQPVLGGEKITLRILNPDELPSVAQLFVGQPQMAESFSGLARFSGKNANLVLISGPTGSGKTATLYTLLQQFERDRFNLVTVENPVEFTISFARQIQINQILNQKAVDIERSILRHDPDIIMFGELRDYDMARAALNLTESGHFVFATIHAPDALQTYERLLNFFPPEERNDAAYILGDNLQAIINQRLVPRLCKCAEPINEGSSVRRAIGCAHCNNTGYFGRVVAHDTVLLPVDEVRRRPISKAITKDGSRLDAALSYEGVRRITRVNVLDSLVEAGQIDSLTRDDFASRDHFVEG